MLVRPGFLATVGAAAALVIPPATGGPLEPARIALGVAQTRFHTKVVHVEGVLGSRRDPEWVLVTGRATRRNRLWAAWLDSGEHAHWTLRYFDKTAPFEPQSARNGLVPCDLYPAFAEPRCPVPPQFTG